MIITKELWQKNKPQRHKGLAKLSKKKLSVLCYAFSFFAVKPI